MRNLLRSLTLLIVVTGFFACCLSAARADITWTFSGAGFDDGGTLSGQFTINVYGNIEYNNLFGNTDYSIKSTAGSNLNAFGYMLPGSVYTGPPVTQALISSNKETVDFFSNGASYDGIYLELTFANPLNTLGPNSIVSGFECGVGFGCPSSAPDFTPTRYINSFGVTSAVPEPGTWAMMVLGFLGLGFVAYRRKGRASGSSFRFT